MRAIKCKWLRFENGILLEFHHKWEKNKLYLDLKYELRAPRSCFRECKTDRHVLSSPQGPVRSLHSSALLVKH